MIQKYIIINGQPILFPAEIMHADMVDNALNVESAGFFVIIKDLKEHVWKVVCMGKSTSLDIHSRPDVDEMIIKAFLRLEK